MIERVVEDWLTNVNELGYETAFYQGLLSRGHTIIHRQEHGPMELGKDLITRDESGLYHCYQLKGGDISQAKWQDICGQIQSTVTSPILHPNVPVESTFTPYLVTNGNISDPVRVDIHLRNQVWEKQCGRKLELILYNDLLKMFLDLQASFLPTKPKDFQLFLGLYLSDKRAPLACDQFSLFLRSMLPEDEVTRAELRRLLAATVIVSDYIISGYEGAKNCYEAAQAWSLLAFHLLRTCELVPTKDTILWRPVIEIVREKIQENVDKLTSEALESRNWMEGNYVADENAWPYRCTMLVAILSAAILSARLRGVSLPNEDEVFACIAAHVSGMKLWGEAASPAYFLAAATLCMRGSELAGIELAMKAINTITQQNRRGAKGRGLPDPYFGPEDVMRAEILGQEEEVYGRRMSFSGNSYSIQQLIEFVVRRNWPQHLRKAWYRISEVASVNFAAARPVDHYWWHCEMGTTSIRMWPNPQKWSDLVKEALSTDENLMLLNETFPELLPYYFLFMPHRFTAAKARAFDIKLLCLS